MLVLFPVFGNPGTGTSAIFVYTYVLSLFWCFAQQAISVGRLNSCWHSPVQSFLVAVSWRSMTDWLTDWLIAKLLLTFAGTAILGSKFRGTHDPILPSQFWDFLNMEDQISVFLSSSESHIATDGQSISKSWRRAPFGAHDLICITLWQLQSCFCGAPSLTRGRSCLLYMLLALAR
jgi:hypothetical protein